MKIAIFVLIFTLSLMCVSYEFETLYEFCMIGGMRLCVIKAIFPVF